MFSCSLRKNWNTSLRFHWNCFVGRAELSSQTYFLRFTITPGNVISLESVICWLRRTTQTPKISSNLPCCSTCSLWFSFIFGSCMIRMILYILYPITVYVSFLSSRNWKNVISWLLSFLVCPILRARMNLLFLSGKMHSRDLVTSWSIWKTYDKTSWETTIIFNHSNIFSQRGTYTWSCSIKILYYYYHSASLFCDNFHL